MKVLVLGGSASGKSEIAENISVRLSGGGKLYYLATMRVFSGEDKARVAAHRLLRKGKGFETVEKPLDIGGFCPGARSTVLLECMSNLLANEMFSEESIRENSAEKILSEIALLSKNCRNLVIVSPDVFRDGEDYGMPVREYISALGVINRELARFADIAIESVAGIEVILKGKEIYEKLV